MNRQSLLREVFDPALEPKSTRLAGLSNLEGDDRDELRRLLSDTPLERRLRVAEDLLQLAEDNPTLSFEFVFRQLLGDSEPRVRRLAIEGLWEDDSRDLIDPLVRLLRDDPEPAVRQTAALSLGRFVVLNEFDAVRPRDAEKVIAALREAIDDFAQTVDVRARAVEAIGASSAPWVEELIERAYIDDEPRMQLSALNAMGRNADARWLPTLLTAMESEDPERRYEAALAAGQIGDDDAVPALNDLIEDEDAEVRAAAITALGQLGGEIAIEALEERLAEFAASEELAPALRAALVEARGETSLLPTAEDDEIDDLDEAIAARLASEDDDDDDDEP
jgi:HEAT repeat protein